MVCAEYLHEVSRGGSRSALVTVWRHVYSKYAVTLRELSCWLEGVYLIVEVDILTWLRPYRGHVALPNNPSAGDFTSQVICRLCCRYFYDVKHVAPASCWGRANGKGSILGRINHLISARFDVSIKDATYFLAPALIIDDQLSLV